jgi:hypothetical protein
MPKHEKIVGDRSLVVRFPDDELENIQKDINVISAQERTTNWRVVRRAVDLLKKSLKKEK